jgi:predicted dehydrogenase
MKVGIIGCGLIGNKRAAAVMKPHSVEVFCDVDGKKAQTLASKYGCGWTDDPEEIIENDDIDIIIVSTPNNQLAPMTLKAVKAGKHVIVEKPGAISSAELEPVLDAINGTDIKVKVGFNHRYHPALLKAKELVDSGDCGEIMFIRGRYGHGGRVGYEKEWRANPTISGGGETMDQGVHLIDLSRWFMGDFTNVDGFATTYFWEMPVDDNGFIALRKDDGRAAWLQVSCTEWKNMFSFEIYCRNAKLDIFGLGGSYGTERLAYYKMRPEMGPPDTMIYEYPRGDDSWRMEFQDLVEAIQQGKQITMGDIYDAYEAIKTVEIIYKGHSTK